MNKIEILENVEKLICMYEKGLLGGEIMPEDKNHYLDKSSPISPKSYKGNIPIFEKLKEELLGD